MNCMAQLRLQQLTQQQLVEFILKSLRKACAQPQTVDPKEQLPASICLHATQRLLHSHAHEPLQCCKW